MIYGTSIPVLSPYKFYPATDSTGDGVNFQNVDNKSLPSQEWGGVYPNCFNQPVPRYWNDYSPGLDFQVYLDTTVLAYADIEADLVDLDGDTILTLSKEQFLVVLTNYNYVRFFMDEWNDLEDGYYRIKIYEDAGDDIYLSEIIEIADTFDSCFPFEFSNFENDFGVAFEGTSDDWKGKVLLPMRMFKPMPSDERESYQDDNGILTTLRSVPNRVYELESLPVTTWFAEKIKLMFSCSDLVLNKVSVNSSEAPDIEVISESDLMTITGEVQMNDFADGYFQEDKIDSETELITSWTNNGFDTLDTDGKDITSAIANTPSSPVSFESNDIAVVADQEYLLSIVTTINFDGDPDIELGGDDITDSSYINKMIYKAATTDNIRIEFIALLSSKRYDFSSICSMKKIT